MTVYVVQYHSNAWGDQESMDDILGIYSTEEAANKRADEYELDFEDDQISVEPYEVDEDVPTIYEEKFFTKEE